MNGKLLWLVLLLAALVISGAPAKAQTTDPAVLHIGTGSGTPCAQGGCFVFGGTEVNGIGATKLDIFENGMGQPSLVNPVLLIIGIPNGSGTAPATITLSMGTGQLGGTNAWGGSWNTTTGSAGSFTALSTQPVYEFIGLLNGSSSQSFVNWSAAESAVLGITATNFSIFVYTLNGTGITGNTGVDVTFSSALPKGTFVVAYGCSVAGTTCSDPGKTFSTPFTQSGLVVPEPGTMALLGTGLLGLAGLVGRKLLAR